MAPPPPSGITVSVSPSNAALLTGATQQFTSIVTGTTNTGVNWSVNNVAGGNSTLGRVTSSGLYTAPDVPPAPSTVTVRATSVADGTKSGTASVAVENPAPQLASLITTSVEACSGDNTLTLGGSNFSRQSVVQAGGTPLATAFQSASELRAVLAASLLETATTLPITVFTPPPGGGTSAALDIEVTPATSQPTMAVAAGGAHSLFLKDDGTVWAWGKNRSGQLGDGTATDRANRVQVAGMGCARAIAAGWTHSLVVKQDGSVWAWGENSSGQLGNGTTTDASVQVQVVGLSQAKAIAAGGGDAFGSHSLGLKADGTVWAWGSNAFGQLGDASNVDRRIPVQVVGLTNVVVIAAGRNHSLALKDDGTVWAWGENSSGQLGDATTTARNQPVRVLGLTGVIALAAGGAHSLAVLSDTSVWAWGDNSAGQLGDGTFVRRSVPVQVAGLSGVAALAAGKFHSLAVKPDGTMQAWGGNHNGQLGNGTTEASNVPVAVAGLGGVTAIAAGGGDSFGSHSLVLKNDGSLWAWGNNRYGQLGNSQTTDFHLPVAVGSTALPALPTPVLVGAADVADCASSGDEATGLLLDAEAGTVFVAGDNAYDSGTEVEFTNCYEPSWGRHRARTHPAPGNHDYFTPGASGYFGYFGTLAGASTRGYYSYDLGAWHVIVLNSNCSEVGGCQAGSAQEQWLRADLSANPSLCTVAYWHHPRFTSGVHGGNPAMDAFWRALYAAAVELVMAGHDHVYERFAPQNPDGLADPARGIRQITVGTGGSSHEPFGTPISNSEARNNDAFGVLRLTLRPSGYDWVFLPEAGKTFTDSGSTACH